MELKAALPLLLFGVFLFISQIDCRDIIWSQIQQDASRSQKLELLNFLDGSGSGSSGSGSGFSGSGSGSGLNVLTNCPTNPTQYCDFYFEGSQNSLPLLSLPANGTSDVAISPPIRDAFRGPSDPLGFAEVDSTAPGQFLCPAPQGTNEDGTNTALGNSFYITSSTNSSGSSVFVRNLGNLANETVLQNRCVLLPITSAQVYPNGSEVVVNLNKGDGNSAFPESRRCVVFQTGPTATFCQAVPPAPAPTSAPPPSSCPPCPASPTESCDFVFQGFENTIPTFNVANVTNDQPFTPDVEYSSSSNGTLVTIEIDSTGPVCTPVNPQDSVFYGSNSKISARNVQNGNGAYNGGCFKVPLTSIAVTLPGTNSPVNVNQGDNNQMFPEERRCVWFKTA